MTAHDPGRRVRWLAVAALVATFALGAACGLVVDRALLGGAAPERGLHVLGDPFADAGVTPAQRRQIDAVFERYRPQLDALTVDIEPRMRVVREQIRGEIDAILTPAQRRRLEALRPERPPGALPLPLHLPPPPSLPGTGRTAE